jgi:hypothetical protein
MMSSISTAGGKSFPGGVGKLPYFKPKSIANWMTVATATNLTFMNFKSGSRQYCSSGGGRQVVFSQNPLAPDHIPIQEVNNAILHNVADGAMAYMSTPPHSWANPKDCGNFPCTAPLNAAFKLNSVIATGDIVPNIPGIESSAGIDVQILPNNPGAAKDINT